MFKYKEGYRVPAKVTGDEACEELERIRSKYKILTAEIVVEESRPVNSVLHDYFMWNNEKAGELYRRQQANQLIRAIVRYEPHEPEHREYVLVTSNGERQYKPMILAVEETDEAKDAFLHLAAKLNGALQSFVEYNAILKKSGKRLSKQEKYAFNLIQKAEKALSSV